MPSIIVSVGLVLLSIYVFIRFKWRKYYEFADQVAGPKEYPLLGSVPYYIGLSSSERLAMILHFCKEFRNTAFRAWLGPVLVFTPSEPDDFQVLFNSQDCLHRGFVFEFLDLPKGLLGANPELWKIHRKYLNPCFNPKILKSYIPIFNEQSKILGEKLDNQVGKGVFDVLKYTQRCTLDMITTTTLGVKKDLQNNINEAEIGVEGLNVYSEKLMKRIFTIWHYPKFIYKMSKDYKIAEAARFVATRLSREIFASKKAEYQNVFEVAEPSEIEDNELKKPDVFINQIFKLSKQFGNIFDDEAIKNEIDTIFTTGFDTTALSLANTILLLAMEPEIQDKVAAEVKEIFGDDDINDVELISKLNYLEMVIKESLRLVPIVPVSTRKTTAEVKLASRNLSIPPEVLVVFPIYTLHRNPRHWGPNAEKFDPENFTEENIKKRHAYSYIPFGMGIRNCMGIKYAFLSMKIALATVIRKYKFSTTYKLDTIRTKCDFIMKLDHEHSVSVELR